MKKDRYIRQTTLKGFGREKQALLKKAKVVVVGVGGLGIPVLQYLNAMGVGTLGMVEQDVVEWSNLQRQVLFGEGDVGKPKLKVAHERLKGMNSETRLCLHDTFLTKSNALDILSEYDLVVDASDNFPTRYLINDACVILKIPFVSGALHGFEGQVSVFNYEDGPTYRCLFPSTPEQDAIPDCNVNGVLGVLPGIIGTLQALEAVKTLTHMPGILKGVLLLYSGLDQTTRHIKFSTVRENKHRTQLESGYEIPDCNRVPTIDVFALKKEMKGRPTRVCLVDVREAEEYKADGLEEAINIPIQELALSKNNIPDDRILYFICKSGSRSRDAIRILQPYLKDTPMFSVDGGMESWLDQFAVYGKIK